MTQSKLIGSLLCFIWIEHKNKALGTVYTLKTILMVTMLWLLSNYLKLSGRLEALAMTNLKTLMDGFFDIEIKPDRFLCDIDNIVALGQLLI